MTFPKQVKIVEVGPRDGLQHRHPRDREGEPADHGQGRPLLERVDGVPQQPRDPQPQPVRRK